LTTDNTRLTRTVARLLQRANYTGPSEPRQVRAFAKAEPQASTFDRRPRPGDRGRPPAPMGRSEHAPRVHAREGVSTSSPRSEGRETTDAPASRDRVPPRAQRAGGFVPFRVTWGGEQGADARRLLAMVCRRGEVRGADVGSIRVARGFSTVEIATDVADLFAETVAKPDPRNPRVFIKRDSNPAPAVVAEGGAAARPARPRPRSPFTRIITSGRPPAQRNEHNGD
jgi:ATP-dependent RNA helicase DeaD